MFVFFWEESRFIYSYFLGLEGGLGFREGFFYEGKKYCKGLEFVGFETVFVFVFLRVFVEKELFKMFGVFLVGRVNVWSCCFF